MDIQPEHFTVGANAATSAMNLAAKLAEVRGKTTFSWLDGAREKAKRAENKEETRQAYEEIISGLTQANAEYENIARGYKDLYEQVVISEKDMDFLHDTMQKALLIMFTPTEGDTSDQVIQKQKSAISAQALLNLIDTDTLRTMQLLGFNYKEAIGKPLTEACAKHIEIKLAPQINKKNIRK